MKRLILVILLITGLLAGAAGTASAENVLYPVFANYTGLIPNATEDEESIIVIYAYSLDDSWTDLMPFVTSGPGSEEVLETALSANSIGAYLIIESDDAYLEEGSMPIFQILTTIKPVEDEEETDAESLGQKLSPEISKDVEALKSIQNRF